MVTASPIGYSWNALAVDAVKIPANNAVAKSAFFIVFLLKDCWVLRGFFALIFHNKQSKYGSDE